MTVTECNEQFVTYRLQLAHIADYECVDCQARALLEKRILTNSGRSKPPFMHAFELGWSGLAPEPLPGPAPSCRGAILKAAGHSGQRVRDLRNGRGIDVIEEPVAYAGQVHRPGGLQLGHAPGVSLATLPRTSEELATFVTKPRD